VKRLSQIRQPVLILTDGVGNVLGPLDQNSIDGIEQHSDPNGPWTTGLGRAAVNNGRGQLVRSGTNARLFRTTFPTARPRSEEELEKHKDRLAAALGIDMAQRVLDVTSPNTHHSPPSTKPGYVRTKWNGTEWVNDGPIPKPQKPIGNRTLPTAPFRYVRPNPVEFPTGFNADASRVLDAPNLRDDFYCSTLAYSGTAKTLAVGLGHLIYGWSESRGVRLLNSGPDPDCYLTSLSFSSTEGCKAILAFGRSDGTLGLLSLYDDSDPASRIPPKPRFETPMPSAVACVSWKPVCTIRPSKSWEHPGLPVKNEDLLVGDETGLVYYYAVEWPERWEVERNNWSGDMTLLARISAHSQQICGLAWSRTADVFATGGNDNLCWLFEAVKVEPDQQPDDVQHQELQVPEMSNPGGHARDPSEASATETEIFKAPSHPPFKRLGPADARHRWPHGAAVKAIAFCPWQDSLVATGGGSNDKCIHFFHTGSGAALASISVSAQVTSLIWSTTRREIAATFGYAQPDHPVRIAVFSWPECRQVAAIPWAGEHRALYAIPYPGGPRGQQQTMTPGNHERRAQGGGSSSRTTKEGCIMVASSDKSVKFHEVWASDKKGTASTAGVLGGSPILEFLEGIDREGEVIR
jgi:meiosis-specific APC/C activator protein AMA1